MTTRADVERLRTSTGRIVDLIRADLRRLFASLDLSRPERARDALLEAVPALVREYGDAAAVVAAEWYEEIRAAQVGGAYAARLAGTIPEAAPISSVRYAAGHLFDRAFEAVDELGELVTINKPADPAKALALLSGSLQRHVLYSSRETVARNVRLDPAQPRFARIPTGPTTCAWCEMLASRGFAYFTEASAGDREGTGVGDDFHDDCDCQVVAEFDREAHHIAGYDPDAMYDRYGRAREHYLNSDDPDLLAFLDSLDPDDKNRDMKAIAFSLRRLYPDQYKDGVHPH
ncbi:VG15 protein [Arthrobacter sp. USHLN218]|uniref:VG15 protein n=1 Tax=Arthrobacter sp. USHLN218 TaxID=3081232 RepID=UPI0030191FE7